MNFVLTLSRLAENIWSLHHLIGADVASNGSPSKSDVLEVRDYAMRIVSLCNEWISNDEKL